MPISDQLVTPAIAAEWLAKNQDNRPVSKATVDLYAKEMRSGLWFSGGADAIVFSKSGSLINGQHRLHAIVKSGISVEMGVRTEADHGSFVAMDQGRRRSAADHPCLSGLRNRNIIAGALRFIDAYQTKTLTTCSSIPRNIMIRDVERVFVLYPEIDDLGCLVRSHKVIRSASILGVLTIACRNNRQDAIRFFTSVGSGENLPSGSVEVVLRRQLELDLASRAKEPRLLQAARVIKAWNLYQENKRTGRNRNFIRVAANEPFPTIS